MNCAEVLAQLRSQSNPKAVEGMARYGINPSNTLGVSIPTLRKLAKRIGTDRDLAGELWSSGIHEARILAGMIDDPTRVTEKQMDRWARDFDSWDVCDQVCMNLFDKTAFAYEKAARWTTDEHEFVKRAGFALMACLAWHDKEAPDDKFLAFLPLIEEQATDDRNFVKKAANWALRHIGKRNLNLNSAAVATAERIRRIDSKSARWIARDALKELTGEAVQARLRQ